MSFSYPILNVGLWFFVAIFASNIAHGLPRFGPFMDVMVVNAGGLLNSGNMSSPSPSTAITVESLGVVTDTDPVPSTSMVTTSAVVPFSSSRLPDANSAPALQVYLDGKMTLMVTVIGVTLIIL